MKKIILPALVLVASMGAVNAQFIPGQLAVLRAGDGVVSQHLKQAPIFIDQFDPKGFNAAPSFTVQIPTNGANSFFSTAMPRPRVFSPARPTGACWPSPVMAG